MKFKNKLKNKIYAIIFYQTSIGEFLEVFIKYFKFKSYAFDSAKLNVNNKVGLEHYLIKQYHIIEKGLSLPDVRLGFGQEKIADLLDASFLYFNKYGSTRLTSAISATLKMYIEFNDEKNYIIDIKLKNKIEEFILATINAIDGGVRNINKEKLLYARDNNKYGLINTRHSIRVFSGPVSDVNKIKSAVMLGKRAPSVCNRQGWKVHYYNDIKTIREILSLQNGTTGFTDQIHDLIIITVDSKAFTGYEQNQQYIDGGLFAMSLILSLHSEDVAVCPLNACFPFIVESKIKRISDIPDNENIIMFLALGEMQENFKVAVSGRKDTDEILRIHE